MSNLRLLNETTASSVASVQITDVFSSDYDVYKIVIDDYQAATAQELRVRFVNTSGTTITSDHDRATQINRSYDTTQESTNANGSAIGYLGWNSANTVGFGLTMYVFNPYASDSYTFMIWQTSSHVSGSGNLNYRGIGVLTLNKSIGGVEFSGQSSHNLSSINIKIYGLRVDS
tara:strand:+ start:501 stop:1019 length:519 start_codon:yes stop_codon:yes gene_type:complete